MSARARPINRQFVELIGANIRKYRLEKHKPAKQIAKMIGVSVQQLRKYETGEHGIKAADLYAISLGIDVPIDLFFVDYSK